MSLSPSLERVPESQCGHTGLEVLSIRTNKRNSSPRSRTIVNWARIVKELRAAELDGTTASGTAVCRIEGAWPRSISTPVKPQPTMPSQPNVRFIVQHLWLSSMFHSGTPLRALPNISLFPVQKKWPETDVSGLSSTTIDSVSVESFFGACCRFRNGQPSIGPLIGITKES